MAKNKISTIPLDPPPPAYIPLDPLNLSTVVSNLSVSDSTLEANPQHKDTTAETDKKMLTAVLLASLITASIPQLFLSTCLNSEPEPLTSGGWHVRRHFTSSLVVEITGVFIWFLLECVLSIFCHEIYRDHILKARTMVCIMAVVLPWATVWIAWWTTALYGDQYALMNIAPGENRSIGTNGTAWCLME